MQNSHIEVHWAMSWPIIHVRPADLQTQHQSSNTNTHHLPQWSVWSVWRFCCVCTSAFNGSFAGAWVFAKVLHLQPLQCIFEQSNSTQPFYHSSNIVHPCRKNWTRPMLGVCSDAKGDWQLPFRACVDEAEYGTPEKRQDLALSLCNLETQCRGCLGLGPASNLLDQVPHQTMRDGTPVRFKVHLSKFGFLEDSQLKGPVNSFAVSLSCNHFYQLLINFINFLSTLSTFINFINVLSTFYQHFISFLSTFYQLFINLFINFLSTFYQLFIDCLSTVYQLFISFLINFFINILSTFVNVLSKFTLLDQIWGGTMSTRSCAARRATRLTSTIWRSCSALWQSWRQHQWVVDSP